MSIDLQTRPGFIKNVSIKNFMCHSNLLLTLGSGINFIVGTNGSGKSALVACIALVFGGRASTTLRGKSLDSFIKEGSLQSELSVTLNNEPPELAFRYDTFGSEVTVERILRRDLPSIFRLRTESGKIIECKKDDLADICSFFGIQVDNPLVVLTQDLSKRFLSTSNPQILYEFFEKATYIQTLQEEYAYASSRSRTFESSLTTLDTAIPEVEKEISDLHAELRVVELANEAEIRIKELQNELIWKHVEVEEANVKTIEMDAASASKSICSLGTDAISCAQSVESLKSSLESQSQTIDQQDYEQKSCENEIEGLKRSLHVLDGRIKESEMEVTVCRKEYESLKVQLRKFKEESSEEPSEEVTKLNLNINEKKRELRALDNEMQSVVNDKLITEGKIKILTLELDSIESQISDLASLKRSSENHPIETFKAIITKSSNMFKKFPLGPICDFVHINDYSWRSTVDAIIGQYMDNFIVFNHSDRETLTNLMHKNNVRYPILILDPTLIHSIGANNTCGREGTISLSDILEFHDVAVELALSIFEGIDRIQLADNRDIAVKVMSNRPKNIDSVFTKRERIQASKGSVSVFQLYSSNNTHLFKNSTNSENFLNELKAKEHRLKHEITLLKASFNQNYEIEKMCIAKKEVLKSDTEAIVHQRDGVTLSIERLKDSASKDVQVTEQETSIEKCRDQLVALAKSLKALEGEANSLRDQISVKEKELIGRRTKHEKSLVEYQKLTQILKDQSKQLVSINEKVDCLKQKLFLNEENYDTLKTKLNTMIMNAQKIGHRVYTTKTIEEVDDMLHTENIRMTARSINQVDVSAVSERLRELNIKFHHLSDLKDEVEISSESINSSTTRRIHALNQFKKMISRRSAIEFSNIMSSRGFNAELQFDHEEKKLHISVTSNASSSSLDVKQLSGGEKSFGTSCFLLSLWDCIGSPFRFLDEFDVFMVRQ